MADPALQRWLQSRLEASFRSTDSWVVEGVAAALLCCGDAGEAQTTVDNFLGESVETSALVQELFERRSAAAAPPAVLREQGGRELRAYVKPPRELPTTRAAEQRQQRPSIASSPAAPPAPRGRTGKAAAVAESECLAPGRVWRGAVVNCLSCGLVHDCRGESALLSPALQRFLDTGACSFCGQPVSAAEPPAGCDQAGAAGAAAAALRLVTFDRESSQRNALIDDQCDYVSAEEANPWLSAQEKEALRVAAAAAASAAEERRKRVSVTIDLVGRRVITEGEHAAVTQLGPPEAGLRLFGCPAPHTPKYVSQQCADDTAPKQKQKQRAHA